MRSSSFKNPRGRVIPKPTAAISTNTEPESNGPPDAASELQELAKTSRGESPFSGYRGLAGGNLVKSFTVSRGLEDFDSERDQHPAGVREGQHERQRQQMQASLDRSVGGPSSRGKKQPKPKGGESGGENDATLYG